MIKRLILLGLLFIPVNLLAGGSAMTFDVAPVVNGVSTTADQTIGGNKTFNESVTITSCSIDNLYVSSITGRSPITINSPIVCKSTITFADGSSLNTNKRSAVIATLSVDQPIEHTGSPVEVINFDTIVKDTLVEYSTGTGFGSYSMFYATSSGTYFVSASLTWNFVNADEGYWTEIAVQLAGGGNINVFECSSTSGNTLYKYVTTTCSGLVYLNAGDAVFVRGRNNAGATRNVYHYGPGLYGTYFCIHKVSDY